MGRGRDCAIISRFPAIVLTMDREFKGEKALHTATVTEAESDLDFGDKDEALKLVGLERSAVFSEEYYSKLRRKLVSVFQLPNVLPTNNTCAP